MNEETERKRKTLEERKERETKVEEPGDHRTLYEEADGRVHDDRR